MRFDTIRYEKRDGVAIVTLARPERHNAIDAVMARELPLAWQDIERDASVAVVVVTGSGERAFCTGYDVGDVASGRADAGSRTGAGSKVPLGFTALQNRCFKPVITAINGMICGGGLHFIADTDLAIAAESATFFDTHVNVGLVAGLEPIGLARRMALEPVLRMALVGRAERMSARRAYELGLVGEVVPASSLLSRALELAQAIRLGSPTAIAMTKRAIWESLDGGLADAHELGWRIIEAYWGHPDIREGAASFAERRPPRWAPLEESGWDTKR